MKVALISKLKERQRSLYPSTCLQKIVQLILPPMQILGLSRVDMLLQDKQELRLSARDERAAGREMKKNSAFCNQLLEQYALDSQSLEKIVGEMSEVLHRQPLDHAEARGHRRIMEIRMQRLATLVGKIQDIAPQQSINEEFAVINEAATNLKEKYRLIFPKPSSAPSSTITSAVASEISRISAKEVLNFTSTKEAIAKEGEASALLIGGEITELHKKIMKEELQIEEAKMAEKRLREEARKREEEERRKFDEDREKARLRTEEIEKEVKRRQEEMQQRIDAKRQEKEAVTKMYKEKECQVLAEFITRDEPADHPAAPPPTLPPASMVDLYLHRDHLGSIKREVFDNVLPQPVKTTASSNVPATCPSSLQSTTSAIISMPANAVLPSRHLTAPAPRLLNAPTSAIRQSTLMGPAIISTAPYQSLQTVRPPSISAVLYLPLRPTYLAHYQPQTSMQSVPTYAAPNLPLTTISSFPFLYCGIDCFGPFLVKEGRNTLKRYGLMVTCLATRAVHIELLDDMTTDALINALRCVIAIRGRVKQIRCDRGTNFVGASRELVNAWKKMDHDSLKAVLLRSYKCDWIFNPPAASHAGGVWERMIRSARRILNGLMSSAEGRLTTSSLRTLMYEVMAIMNSRPLSVESLEDPTGPLPLTPNHILTTKSSGILPPPGVFQKADLSLKKQWRKVQHLADQFWEEWRRDYLMSLQARRKWQREEPNLEVGDIVILREDSLCRADWRLARVLKVFPSDDGLVRRCRLWVPRPGGESSSDGNRSRELERPVCRLTLVVRSDKADTEG